MKRLTLLILLMILVVGCTAEDSVSTEDPVTTETEEETTEPLQVGRVDIRRDTVTATEDVSLQASGPLFNERYPFAIMISNSPEARPQSGFNKAKVVYEMLVEGRTTRYLMVIDRNDDTLIGPVRSARPSFLNTVLEYDAFYGHVGNSYLVYNTIKDFDQFFHGVGAYYRSDHRYAPHNVYAHMDDLYAAAAAEGYEIDLPEEGLSHFEVYEEKQKLSGGTPVSSIAFSYDGSTHYIYRYDEAKNSFLKEVNGTLMQDEYEDDPVTIANFILIRFPDQGYMENGIHRRIEYIGQGVAEYFVQGQKFDITWQKERAETPMKFFLADKELILQPGLTMVNFVEEGMSIDVR